MKRPPESPKPPFEQCDLLTTAADAEFAAGVARGNAIAAGQAFTRGLQVLPGNTCTPEFLAQTAHRLAERHGFAITVLDRKAIVKEGMQALMAVAQGSALEPRFIVLEYKGQRGAAGGAGGQGRHLRHRRHFDQAGAERWKT